MKFKSIALMALFFTCVTTANASLITVDRADAVFGNANIDLQAAFAGIDAADITSEALPSDVLLYNGSQFNDTIYKLTMDFTSSKNRVMDFFAGLDAGRGAELYLNGTLVNDANQNLWWSRNFNSSQVFDTTGLNINAGQNIVELYWAENGNSGGNSFLFSIDGGNAKVLSADNLTNSVPSPSLFVLLGLGLAGLVVARRK